MENKTQPACFNEICSLCRSERCGVDRVANQADLTTPRSTGMLEAPLPPKTVKHPGVARGRGRPPHFGPVSHSYLSAVIGSTRLARLAGYQLASMAIASHRRLAAANAVGSNGLKP